MKFPENLEKNNSTGLNYAYCDSNNGCEAFNITDSLLNDAATSPLILTMLQIKDLKSGFGSIFWNDQPPNDKQKVAYAHEKGFTAFDEEQGFIMGHSTPKFPCISGKETIYMDILPGERYNG